MHLILHNHRISKSKEARSLMEEHIFTLLKKVDNMKQLKQVHALITKTGLSTNLLVLTKLLICSSLPSWGSLEHAHTIFNTAAHQNDVIQYNTMIRAYSKSIFPIEAIKIYNTMCRRIIPTDHLTYPFVLRACGRAGGGEFDCGRKGAEVHCRIWHLGFIYDVIVMNCLMFMYAQCGSVELARKVFDEMAHRNVASWNTMIVAYDRCGEFDQADLFTKRMPEKDVVSQNIFVGKLARMGNVQMARRIFEVMQERDAVSWNSMITGYVSVRDYRSAFILFGLMQADGVKPTEITLVSVLGACAETGAFIMGKRIHEYMKHIGLKAEGYMGNALMDMYVKSGDLRLAMEIFDEMHMKHITCWNTMIVGFAIHGYCKEALELFYQMKKETSGNLMPNRVTFLGILLACSHKGSVEEAQMFFHMMVDEYKITPDVKHYGCMIDTLSRGGLLYESYRMIKTMPFKANAVIWRAILGACRVHGNVEMAEEAFGEIREFESPNYGDCLLLSTVYAESGRWDDLKQLRDKMTVWGISRQSGFSQIEEK